MRVLAPSFSNALPFWISLAFIPLVVLAAWQGGWWIALVPLFGWVVMSVLDKLSGLETGNMDLETGDAQLYWYRFITQAWVPIQMGVLFGALMVVSLSDHLGLAEKIFLMMTVGVLTGGIGINYAHELIHQRNRFEQRLGEVLLMSVGYAHFRTEHLLVHHRYVGTPRDPVTARKNEGFWTFFPRVFVQEYASSWKAEAERLARKGLPSTDRSNPFWRYGMGTAVFVWAAWVIGGWAGIGFWAIQAFVAIYQLELINYIEHYGLTRKHLGDGKYEHVQPHHSWNASHRMTNFLLINLQRHSDHHYKPDRRFPLLQHYDKTEAPQLPFGYPLMSIMALLPPLWCWIMNRRVDSWRARHYPDIDDWAAYDAGTTPLPR